MLNTATTIDMLVDWLAQSKPEKTRHIDKSTNRQIDKSTTLPQLAGVTVDHRQLTTLTMIHMLVECLLHAM
jgi:hypothetical protein